MAHNITASRQRVVIVQPWLRQYRQAFYELLRARLESLSIDLDLVYGMPQGVHGGRGDTTSLVWARYVDKKRLRFGPYELTWQPCLDVVRGADLVIVEQAARHLLNYVLLAGQAAGGPRVAFWGHGRNFQATTKTQRASEIVKRGISNQSHWFFAYNDLSADVLIGLGYPRERVTVVANSIDTRALTEARDKVSDEDRQSLRQAIGIQGQHVGIYCGAMYEEKRLPFLVAAAQEIRQRVPDFELLCVGGGVDQHVVEEATAEHDWIHYVGPQFGDDLARYFALAQVHLLPGLVGLAVLDSFVLEVPLVTTVDALHSPEISYLVDGVNGVIVPGDGSGGRYAGAVARVLTEEELRERLILGCRRSAQLYSAEAMADRFVIGILSALKVPPRGLARLAALG